ncbi:hypothetical protein BDZ91DRAFT_130674 [Kalaharituber pfeilii]|nr:hypothetical protein BDZ91DRAFT_130674 [Kalaharituber pfeilii]
MAPISSSLISWSGTKAKDVKCNKRCARDWLAKFRRSHPQFARPNSNCTEWPSLPRNQGLVSCQDPLTFTKYILQFANMMFRDFLSQRSGMSLGQY